MLDLNDAPLQRPPATHYDLDEIVRRLRDTAHLWVPQHFPNGRREGDAWRLANIKGDAPRKNGSCVIALKGPHAGDWYDHDGGQGGGPLSTLEQATGLNGRNLIAHAASLVGSSPNTPARRAPELQQGRLEKDSKQEIEIVLSRAVPIGGTLGETYLRVRGLSAPACDDLLFHPDLTHWETKTGFPALVAIVRDQGGEIVAIHRTYLRPDGTAKAEVPKPRKMLGRIAGGAVRLAAIGGDGVLGISEGIETALAVMTACPGLAVWAALSATNLEQAQLPPEARDIILLADNDASGAGLRAAEAASHRFALEGRNVAIALPPREGDDFNDVLLREGPGKVARIVRDARLRPSDTPSAPAGRHLPIGFKPPSLPLPIMRTDEGDLARACDRAWGLLFASNRDPWLFRAGGTPSWVVPDDEGRPMAVALNEERLRHMLAKLAIWRRLNRAGDLVSAPPPTNLIKTLLATPDPGLPVLAGIVTTPVFGRNGSLLTEPGYHPDARLLYQPISGFALPNIPERPTADEIASARALLIDDMLADFPFTGPAEQAHALALLLVGFLRAMIDGPTPLHLIEKPSPGTGATLMVDAIATVLTGAGASVMTEGRDDEEWRKRVTAKLRQVPSLVLIDNLRHPLDSSALAAALTAPYWEDRILGVSEMTRLPIRCVWIATGNNPEFSNEMARRIVRIRLDARIDQPWRRKGFRHPDLIGWIRANRARLVAACLTLCRAWIAAGRPRGSRVIGSYESWSQILGAVLEVIGIEGFLGNLDEMMEVSDRDGAIWRSFVLAWWDRFGTAEVGTSDLYQLALVCEPPLPLGSGNERSQRIRLGKALGRMRDRMFRLAGVCVRIEISGTYQRAQRWRLALGEKIGTDPVNVVNVGECRKINIHDESSCQNNGLDGVGECCECFSDTYACARTRAKKEGEKYSQHSQHSPEPTKSRPCDSERVGERVGGHSPAPPAWLEDVP
jgi:hypothetical protein